MGRTVARTGLVLSDAEVFTRPGKASRKNIRGGDRNKNLSEDILRVRRVECHCECHCAGKIGKGTRTDVNADRNWKRLNRCGCERSAKNARIHWGFAKSLPRIPTSQPSTIRCFSSAIRT